MYPRAGHLNPAIDPLDERPLGEVVGGGNEWRQNHGVWRAVPCRLTDAGFVLALSVGECS